MRKIEISITKAQILSYSVTLSEELPKVHATIGLFTDAGAKISEYSISTDHWEKQNCFDLPAQMVAPIVAIAKELERIVAKHCNDTQKALAAPNVNQTAE